MQTEEKDEQQQYCIEHTEGKYLVIAGPGTGKTHTVSKRIKNIIEKGCEPSKILCLTYTEAAASEMDKKIKKALNNDDLELNIFTFHGFCMQIIQNHPDKFQLSDDVKLISNSVKRILMKECIDEIQSEYYITENGSRYYYISDILRKIEDIKKHNLSDSEFLENLNNSSFSDDEKTKNQMEELLKFKHLYEQKMQQKNYIDFSDMIIKVLDAFQNKEFLKEVASEYEYIHIDEYQDTSPVQNQIIYALGEVCENIFAVGDDDQTIYSFQGARMTTMKEYIEHFNLDDKNVICLKNNRRSTSNIVKVSREIIKYQNEYKEYLKNYICRNDKQKLVATDYKQINVPLEFDDNFRKYKIDKNLNALSKFKNEPVYCAQYNDISEEQNDIISKIEELKDNGVELSEIAIIARKNDELDEYAKLLKQKNIDFELKEGTNIFEINAVNVLIYYLFLLVNPDLYSNMFFSYLLSNPFQINYKDYILLIKNRANYKSLIDNLKAVYDKNKNSDIKKFLDTYSYLEKCKNSINKKNKKFFDSYPHLKKCKDSMKIDEVVLEVMSATGILDEYFNNEIKRVENLFGLKQFVEEANAYQTLYKDLEKAPNLADFMRYIQELIDDGTKIYSSKPNFKLNAVQLTTYHSSKGREFEYVFMPNLQASKWEGAKNRKNLIPLEEDVILQNKKACTKYKYEEGWLDKEKQFIDCTKLLFVGITRAKHELHLSYNNSEYSKFIEVLEDKFKDKENIFKYIPKNEKNVNDEIENIYKNLKTQKNDFYEMNFKELVDYKLKEMTFSPSDLNICLNCRKKFFFEKILELTSNFGKSDFSCYGSSIHKALQKAAEFALENKKYPSKEQIFSWFKEDANSRAFSTDGKKESLVKAKKCLYKYYDEFIKLDKEIKKLYKAEEEIKNYNVEGELFTAVLDRIDRDNEGNYIIYDYKTSSTKTEKEINPKGDKSDYYNQMAFYKYILHKKENIDFDKIRTIFLFPDTSKQTEIFLSKEACIEVKNKYLDVIKKLRNYDFDNSDHNEKACEYCINKTFCNMNII